MLPLSREEQLALLSRLQLLPGPAAAAAAAGGSATPGGSCSCTWIPGPQGPTSCCFSLCRGGRSLGLQLNCTHGQAGQREQVRRPGTGAGGCHGGQHWERATHFTLQVTVCRLRCAPSATRRGAGGSKKLDSAAPPRTSPWRAARCRQ